MNTDTQSFFNRLVTHNEVIANREAEAKRVQDIRDKAREAMRLAQGYDSRDYADSPQNRVQEIVILGVQS